MGFFSNLFGKREPPPDPATLADQLFAVAGEPRKLEPLCKQHRDMIREQFDGWRKVPDTVREKPALVQDYLMRLLAIAQMFEQRLDDPSLMNLLQGTPDNNPLLRWQQQLQHARQLKEQMRFADAVSLLTDALIDVRELKGSGVDTYLPVTLGELGECYFQSGETHKAITPTKQALDIVQRTNDPEGVIAYLGNLYEMHRYLEQSEEAATYAEQLGQAFHQQGQQPESTRYRKQAKLVRAGEPRNRVVIEMNGQRYEQEEVLEGIEGKVRFLFERNKLTLKPAEYHTQQGEQIATQGHYEEALAHFREASKADPLAPQPHYQAAVTLMHLGRPTDAVEDYTKTEELAPGWFHCRSEMWLAQQIVLGRYDAQIFRVLHAIEDGGFGGNQQREALEWGLSQAPDLAYLYYLQGKSYQAEPRRAIEAFRQGLKCAEEPDFRTRLLAELAGRLDQGPERRAFLEEAIALQGNLVAHAIARLLLHMG
jgi:tetratricopeptide (TPR) repeat protein